MKTRLRLQLLLLSLSAGLSVAGAELAGEERMQAARQIYLAQCAACHGEKGDGDGPATVWLYPKPRDFSAGLFKIKSTPDMALPTDEDLYQTITRGMPGSSMPAFNYLSEAERRAAVLYVKHLSAFTSPSGERINHFVQARLREELRPSLTVPPEPPLTLDVLVRGRELFTQASCNACHGDTGAGDGFSAAASVDFWGLPLPPRDFNTSPFRGGHSGMDLYLRIAAGMPGTPMPAYGDEVLSSEDRWALVHYIRSLRRAGAEVRDLLTPTDSRIPARRVEGHLPDHPADPVWERHDVSPVTIHPLWLEPSPVPALAVCALHNQTRIAFLLQWPDPIADGAPVRVEDFQDGVALQFSLNGSTPFLGMGDAQNPVNIWFWNAGWQEETEGPRPDVETVFPSMYVDFYPGTGPGYVTARAAGNLLAAPERASPVENAQAGGFGTYQAQPPAAQTVQGRGHWRDGHWQVVFTRELQPKDTNNVTFSFDHPVPVAFAVWDGSHRHRNGRKLISHWHHLVLEP